MDLIANDLSIHGQFAEIGQFRAAIARVMGIRQLAKKFGREVQCHRGLLAARVGPQLIMPQAVQLLSSDERRSFLQWTTRQGPFWDEPRRHSRDDYLACDDHVVTDTAVGEAAWCCKRGLPRGLVSFSPSDWLRTPIAVTFVEGEGTEGLVDVSNYWEAAVLERKLEQLGIPVDSWSQLERSAIQRFSRLTFLPSCFSALQGHPFVPGAARRVLTRLSVLDRLHGCYDSQSRRTAEGHDLYQQHFTGDNAWFTDSSSTEKATFRRELTFRGPSSASEEFLCSWHGKVNSPQLRIHFSWPVGGREPLFIAYVGPKITKR